MGLKALPNLKILSLSRNQIKKLDGIAPRQNALPALFSFPFRFRKKQSFPPYCDLERRKRGESDLKTRLRAQGLKMQRRLSKSSGSGTL